MAWRIPEEEIERVKRQTDLVALVRSRGIELKKHGSKDWVGRCPFHDDQNTPNFIVSPDKGLFHCMVCGKAGNPIQFVQFHDGVSFRHAYEVLAHGQAAAFTTSHQGPLKQGTVPRLPCPVDVEADDATLMAQVAAYYHQRLKETPAARAYLASRDLDSEELIDRFQLGFADRTLGLRLPDKHRMEGERLRTRLQQLGVWRESGHEHFNGCIVVPLGEARAALATNGSPAAEIVSFYGRRAQRGALSHLYPPGPHRGLFNPQGLTARRLILCEAVFDALTFCRHGFMNVTCTFGTEGFTEELWEAIIEHKIEQVLLAYDADQAGDRAAQRDAERFKAVGIEVFRVKFPHGMDANDYARKVTPANKSLALLLNAAAWLGKGSGLRVVGSGKGDSVDAATEPSAPPLGGSHGQAEQLSSLAASVSSSQEDAAKEKISSAPLDVPTTRNPQPTTLAQRGDAWFLDLEGREYRVAGLEKTLGTDTLKVVLRLRVAEASGSDRFHLDAIDLTRDAERRKFIERAAQETGLLPELLKRDVGRLLLAVEQAQAELAKPAECAAPAALLTPEEREEALALLRDPKLVDRLLEALDLCGLAGETNNKLAAYLTGVSRKLERPLALIIQSTSAAGKTTLMEAVLRFFPEEERVKYSAMTGQSLYYLGQTSLQHKILAIVEEEGAQKASYALKLLQSEGELTIASTGKDPATGRMVTQEYHLQGPAAICLTTTRVDLDEELQNRCLILSVDESREQTARIHALQRKARTVAGLLAREQQQQTLKLFGNAQRLLQPWRIVNPFAEQLTFTTEGTRSRRDHEKYLTLIDAITLLHQYQRNRQAVPAPSPSNQAPFEYIEVTLDDIALANRLAPEILARSRDELPPQTRRFLGLLKQLVRQRCAEQKLAQRDCLFSRRELRGLTGWSEFAVRSHLQRLEDLEYVARRWGRQGVGCVYELLMDAQTPEEVAHIGLIDVEALRQGTPATPTNFVPPENHFVRLPTGLEPTSCAGGHEGLSPQHQALAGTSMLRAERTSGGAGARPLS